MRLCYIDIKCTSNNIIATLKDSKSSTRSTLSAGRLKFSGGAKGARAAGQDVIFQIAKKAVSEGFNKSIVRIKGRGKARNSITKELARGGLRIQRVYSNTFVVS